MCSRYESYIDVEIQQRAVEYFELSRKGPALADVLAEMPKFPEREVTPLLGYTFLLVNLFHCEGFFLTVDYLPNVVCAVEEG